MGNWTGISKPKNKNETPHKPPAETNSKNQSSVIDQLGNSPTSTEPLKETNSYRRSSV